jgi:dipeptide/tripeptide permease
MPLNTIFFLLCFQMFYNLNSFCTKNKRHDILFIEGPKNPINSKISI